MNSRDEIVRSAFEQYVEGAITYVEFVNKAHSLVTQEDIDEYQRMTQ